MFQNVLMDLIKSVLLAMTFVERDNVYTYTLPLLVMIELKQRSATL